ncbi:hypothetical protein RJT34_26853 [Clitoria ternatea]|uniref:Gag1-like clamp domain-containing protein n=1 Tax=Clitoria ternatea TaxID=43366 RepID=A0AAN9I9D8_CLITE
MVMVVKMFYFSKESFVYFSNLIVDVLLEVLHVSKNLIHDVVILAAWLMIFVFGVYSPIVPSRNRVSSSSLTLEFIVENPTRVFVGFSDAACIWEDMIKSSCCLGHYKKPTLVATEDVPPKGLRKPGKAVKKPSTSEGFWTTSTHDMDNSVVQSQGSISSSSITNQATDPHGGFCNPTEFVNHASDQVLYGGYGKIYLMHVVEIGSKKSENRAEQLREPKLSWNATYESLLGSNNPLPQSIPLAEMVDFLVDIWEQEGLYD